MRDSKAAKIEVEIFHRINRLKLKAGAESLHAGPGYIDQRSIHRAQSIIEKSQSLYKSEIETVLDNLDDAWRLAQSAHDAERRAGLEGIYHYANHAKDLAATFGYELMQHFGLSLREFSERISIDNRAHHIIVRAHLDVMRVVFVENIRDHGGPKAEELRAIVTRAIEKHSQE